MPIEKENEVREKARLEMERVRHGPKTSTDIATDPNTVDDRRTSSSESRVKWFCPTKPNQIQT